MTNDQLCDADDISDWFWAIVEHADKDRAKLETILQSLSTDDIRRFALEFHDAASALWDALYADHLVHRSEDDVEDVSQWVVSQGKNLYAAVCMHPETIALYEANAQGAASTLAFVAGGILADRLGDAWNLYDDYQDFADSGYTTVSSYWEAQYRQEH